MKFFLKQILTVFILISFLSSCAVVPKFSDKNVPQNCKVYTQSIEFDINRIRFNGNGMNNCQDSSCVGLMLLAAAGILTVSAIIAGSVYVVGNTVHYLEKKGRCD